MGKIEEYLCEAVLEHLHLLSQEMSRGEKQGKKKSFKAKVINSKKKKTLSLKKKAGCQRGDAVGGGVPDILAGAKDGGVDTLKD